MVQDLKQVLNRQKHEVMNIQKVLFHSCKCQILVQRDENFSYSVCLELDFKEIFERDFVISLIHRLLIIANMLLQICKYAFDT